VGFTSCVSVMSYAPTFVHLFDPSEGSLK
jgi:hypothetical protein